MIAARQRRMHGFGVTLHTNKNPSAWSRLLLLALLLACGGSSAQIAASDALLARFSTVREQAARNVFDRPLYLLSTEAADRQQADVYALIDHPFDEVRQTLSGADRWCGVLILHLNVKYCRASNAAARTTLDVGIGRKFDQPLSDVYWVAFDYRVASTGDDYLDISLQAPAGPMNTKDFSIRVEAAAYAEHRTLLHMSYGYSFGTIARWAMQAYLATIGSDKVGFSVVGQSAGGAPVRIGGVRGVLERNTMRYYLAIESYLGAQALPAPQRLDKSVQDWFSATERYAQQLHEIDRDAYVEMKLREARRQETEPPSRRN
jgi:hypothetical protein